MPPTAIALPKRLRNRTYSDPVRQARVDLAAAFRCAARLDWQEGIGGHFSLKVPGEDNLFFLNPLGVLWCEMKASDLLVVDVKGNKVEGAGEVERTAFHVHAHIHKAGGANAHCIIHTHTPYATGMATLKSPRLDFIHQGSLRFYDDVAYDPEYNGMVSDENEGMRIARIMGGKRVCFLANHGTLVTGPDVATTFQYNYMLERVCMYIALAKAHGIPLQSIRGEVGEKTRPTYRREPMSLEPGLYLDALKRQLDAEEPEYAD